MGAFEGFLKALYGDDLDAEAFDMAKFKEFTREELTRAEELLIERHWQTR